MDSKAETLAPIDEENVRNVSSLNSNVAGTCNFNRSNKKEIKYKTN